MGGKATDDVHPFNETDSFIKQTLHTSLRQKRFGAGDAFYFSPTTNQCTSQIRIPRSSLFIFPHTWTFHSLSQARAQLEQRPDIQFQIAGLLEKLDDLEGNPLSSTHRYSDQETLLSNLHRLAFRYEFAAADPVSHELVPLMFNWISTDPVGPAFIPPSSAFPALTFVHFMDLGDPTSDDDLPRAYTVCYPAKEKGLLAGTPLTRNEILRMPEPNVNGGGGGEKMVSLNVGSIEGVVLIEEP